MELTIEVLRDLTPGQRRKVNAYINWLLILQRVPVLHDLIKRLGNWVFYRI